MTQIKIVPLLEGVHKMRNENDGVNIYNHTSSVTLVRVGEKNILVDTGGRGCFKTICEKLEENGLSPKKIDVVILTHFHLDHSYNVALFPNAELIGWNHRWNEKSTFRLKNLESLEIAEGVSIIKTPGHTDEHISVVVDLEDKKVVISGDAINAHYVETKEISSLCSNEEAYIKSAEKILKIADEIIPGHGERIALESSG